jgi:hypothetical protein
MFHAQTSWFGCVSLPDLASYSFTHLTFCQAIALHNVSYKGYAQINNVAFMGHYDMSLHIMMESSYILYAL